jgi:hypothetical protein
VTRGNRRPCLRCEILKFRNPCRPKVAGKNTLILQVGRPALGSRYRKKLETGMKQHLLKARDIAILRWQKASTDWIVCEGSALPTRGGRCRSRPSLFLACLALGPESLGTGWGAERTDARTFSCPVAARYGASSGRLLRLRGSRPDSFSLPGDSCERLDRGLILPVHSPSRILAVHSPSRILALHSPSRAVRNRQVRAILQGRIPPGLFFPQLCLTRRDDISCPKVTPP